MQAFSHFVIAPSVASNINLLNEKTITSKQEMPAGIEKQRKHTMST